MYYQKLITYSGSYASGTTRERCITSTDVIKMIKDLNLITKLHQEPINRSVQLPYFRATAFSQVELFLDMPFPLKSLFLVTSVSKSE